MGSGEIQGYSMQHNIEMYEQKYCWPAEMQNFWNWLHKPQLYFFFLPEMH